MDQLTEELKQVRPLFLAIQSETGAGDVGAPASPGAMFDPEEDVLSMAASATEFADYEADVGGRCYLPHLWGELPLLNPQLWRWVWG